MDKLSKKVATVQPLPESYISATKVYHRDPPQSFQLSQIVPKDQPDYDVVGRPVVHKSALKQATGEAVYIDDMPKFEDELYLALVLSIKPHAKILSIDTSVALKQEGVMAFFCSKVKIWRQFRQPLIFSNWRFFYLRPLTFNAT